MRRIWFKSDTIKRDPEFEEYMQSEGYDVIYGKAPLEYDPGTLVVTDDPDVFKEEENALVYIRDEKDTDLFPGARYFVMDAEDCYADYFVKIWQRFNDLPWVIGETERLILRETVEEDLKDFIEIYKDPRMTEFTEGLFEDEAELEYITEYRKKVYEVQGFGIWTVVRKSDKKIIGRAGLVYRAGSEGVETGFAIGTKYWGEGYGSEAVRECVHQAKRLGFDRVTALVMPGNVRSERLLRTLDFSKTSETVHDGRDYEIWELMLPLTETV